MRSEKERYGQRRGGGTKFKKRQLYKTNRTAEKKGEKLFFYGLKDVFTIIFVVNGRAGERL